ncbi:hypothetical protein GWI33_022289 [Rhynchophorus ferrugineus]|uniref:Uncharacterized protein n=1 Tax=Rhynchophorus ferrugineus TaxID=354439 RepID=A0A834IUS6_RHYFE|nr:hypothetical protein GWI33_022289 [Rhynchophorus ferrugineus]
MVVRRRAYWAAAYMPTDTHRGRGHLSRPLDIAPVVAAAAGAAKAAALHGVGAHASVVPPRRPRSLLPPFRPLLNSLLNTLIRTLHNYFTHQSTHYPPLPKFKVALHHTG